MASDRCWGMRGGLPCCPLNLDSGARLICTVEHAPFHRSRYLSITRPATAGRPAADRSPAAKPRSICRLSVQRIRALYSGQFAVDYRPADARGGGGMGDLCPDAISDRTWACWLSDCRPGSYAFAASRPFGGSVQPQAYHPCEPDI